MHDLHTAFAEIYRVLKPDARLVIFTAVPDQMRGYWLNNYFPKMMADSITQMPSLESVMEAVTAAGFAMIGTEKYPVQNDLQDCFLYVGKNKPELYFDENIRAGIVSFSALSNAREVETGLAQLRADINLGQFDEVRAEYENSLGDYLFIVLQR